LRLSTLPAGSRQPHAAGRTRRTRACGTQPASAPGSGPPLRPDQSRSPTTFIDEALGLKIEQLQHHANDGVYDKAVKILETY